MQQSLYPQTSQLCVLPSIQLCGKWLRDTGFKVGHTIDITCENDKIIITKSASQRFDVK